MTKTRPTVEAVEVTRRFNRRGGNGTVNALDGVSLAVRRGETIGLVGESGSGKSTLGRLLVGLDRPTTGQVLFEGVPLGDLTRDRARCMPGAVQIVFQDPYASLNPRMTVGHAIEEVLSVHELARGDAASQRARDLLDRVGLASTAAGRLPHEFSGGQRQRVGIARALAVEPEVLIADEPVSALDVSVQARILGLLLELQRDLGLGYLFISHDLAVVRTMADRVAVMQSGRIVEEGTAAAVFDQPTHHYTRTLLDAIPRGLALT